MNKHRYQFVYLPLQRRIDRMSGWGLGFVLLGKMLVITVLVISALLWTNLV